ncbi:unnamed protein product [Moneuplotes crassus]|uniref:Lebercilin domain-containing protein n=1 Tax=Euplotes crassus TaxID=5936 RepID=A0AAD1X761_EUPCR|nr:unnamed protein product [Moneuplotes crassus]
MKSSECPQNVDEVSSSSREIIEEYQFPSQHSKSLFSDPSEIEIIEMEIRTSQYSHNESMLENYEDKFKSTESMSIPASEGGRVNLIREAKARIDATKNKAYFKMPKPLMNNSDFNMHFSPREITPPSSDSEEIDKAGAKTIHEETKEFRSGNRRGKKVFEMLPKKSNSSSSKPHHIGVSDSDQVSREASGQAHSRTPPKNGLEQSWSKPIEYQQEIAEHQSQEHSQKHGQTLVKSKTIDESAKFQNYGNFPESQTPNKNSRRSSKSRRDHSHDSGENQNIRCIKNILSDKANQQASYLNTNPTPKPASMQDIHNDHVLISQLTEAQQRIQEQDSLIVTLRSDIKQLQDLLEQKDNQFKSLHTQKVAEATEMNKFYQDRLKAKRMAGAGETPRIQIENQMIREQVRMLLDDAKERTHDIGRLKKLIGMYELQKEEFEHKFTLMRNKEIKLEAELDQAAEKYKAEEAKNRQLKMDYDELKFQMQRDQIFKDIKIPNYKSDSDFYDAADDFLADKVYNPPSFKTMEMDYPNINPVFINDSNNIETRPDDMTDAQSALSDFLYRKNMDSTMADFLRWDPKKGGYTAVKTRNNIAPSHNKTRSVSNPPVRSQHTFRFDPQVY